MTRAADGEWRIGIDTGGTFTDGVAVDPAGAVHHVKILSTGAVRGTVAERPGPRRLRLGPGPAVDGRVLAGFAVRPVDDRSPATARVVAYDSATGALELDTDDARLAPGSDVDLRSGEEAPLVAARLLTGTGLGEPLPPLRLRLATTLGTNLLLERAGEPTALFVTRGFGDLPRIGDQQRPELFDLRVRRPEPLCDEVVEVDERLDAAGRVLRPLDADALLPAIERLRARGVRAAAIALLHAYRNPAHERSLATLLRRAGFEQVSCSAELAPRIKLLPRLETALVDAYLAPRVRAYLNHVAGSLGPGTLLVMTSAGGLLDPGRYRPKDSLYSGPAGGVVGAAWAGRRAGFAQVIGFDMGGTSTDVARYAGDYEYVFEHRVGDARLAAPALAIETVAAGGGSVCWLDGERLRVGPRSAGAEPGPACYGAGGPLCLTDVNLLLGRLDPSRFGIPVRVEPARRGLDELLDALESATGSRPAPETVLEGLVAIADARMAGAIRRVSVRRGYDPTDYALVAFGGAGAQHACGVAGRLGLRHVVVPADGALLSAIGLGHAVVERFAERQVLEPLDAVAARLDGWLDELGREAAADVAAAAGLAADRIVVRRRIVHLRFAGQDSTLDVDRREGEELREAFERRYEELYGHLPERRPIEVESLRVAASTPAETDGGAVAGRDAGRQHDDSTPEAGPATPTSTTRAVVDGAWRDVPRYARERLGPGATLVGPALVHERHSSLFLAAGWSARVDAGGAIICEALGDSAQAAGATATPRGTDAAAHPDAVRLELFTQRFEAIVREMGERLERTAVSTNVKERLDFSCALLDPRGRLVVNAPHIPVHLGALGLCVRRVAETLPLGPGDVAVTNHPAFGGSHLPDVTVITPVFEREGGGALAGWVASRAHHAEIGGARPGSMPPRATCLADEGVVIAPDYLVRGGAPRWNALRRRLTAGPWPSRAVEDNLADLRAAAAANHAGASALRALVAAHGRHTVESFMERLAALSGSRLAAALRRLGDGTRRAVERLDDGTPLAVRIDVEGGRARIDFAGSGVVHPGNLNATPAIVRSAVLYVMRLLVAEPLPLNEGLLDAVEIVLPPGLLDPPFGDDPRRAPAVVGGNVETSQRLVDTLLRALGLAACSQGTMNNLLFGGAGYGYYETLGGGCGAGPDWDGADAVHSHMTNTRITDVEILEHRYPVHLERFAVRRGSGGAGRRRGGDGLVREIRFLAPAVVSVLTQHRVEAPYGMDGGGAGRVGAQRIVRADGTVEPLEAIDGRDVGPGDLLAIETPGGGGWGTPRGGGTETER